MRTLAARDLHPRDAYALLTNLIVPRAIAWVSTMDAAGHTNLAPFSYFTGLGSDPPMVTLAIGDRKDGPKDTLRIARATGVLCVNLVEEHDAVRMNASSRELPADVSEIDALGIDTLPCVEINGVRVASARAAMECKLLDVHTYGDKLKFNLVVCEVVCFHHDEAIATDEDIRPVARLGGPRYARLGERFSLERPKP